MALIFGLSSGEMGCKQLVGIHETQLGSLGGEGGAFDKGSGGVDAAVDGSGGRIATSTGGSGGASSHPGGNSGSGSGGGSGGTIGSGGAGAASASGGSGTGGRPVGSGTGGPATGGSQAGGASPAGAGAGGSPAGGSGAGGTGTGGAPAKKALGAACRMNADCENDLCGAEWVCCTTNCNGQCESCVTASNLGKCVALTTPRTPCDGSGICGGVCNGMNRNACIYPSTGTICGGPSCTGGTAQGAATCTHGACVTPAAMTCAGGCSGSTCKTSCQQPSAANLLANPGFDGSIYPWGGFAGTYYPSDYGDCAGSGSCDVDSSNNGYVSECLPATAGVMYWMSFAFKGSDSTSTHTGSCTVDFFPSTNVGCWVDAYLSGSLGSSLGTSLSKVVTSAAGGWSTSGMVGGPAPAGTGRMSFTCKVSQGRGYFDQLYLGTTATSSF